MSIIENVTLTPYVKTDIRTVQQQMLEDFQEFKIRNDKEPRPNIGVMNQQFIKSVLEWDWLAVGVDGRFYPRYLKDTDLFLPYAIFNYSPTVISSLQDLSIDKLYRATLLVRGDISWKILEPAFSSDFEFVLYMYIAVLDGDFSLPYYKVVDPAIIEPIGVIKYNAATNTFTPGHLLVNKKIDMITNTKLFNVLKFGPKQMFYIIAVKEDNITQAQRDFLFGAAYAVSSIIPVISVIGSISIFE